MNYNCFKGNSYMIIYDMTLDNYRVSNIADAIIVANDMWTTNYRIDTTTASTNTLLKIATGPYGTNKPLSNITGGASAQTYGIALIKELTGLLQGQQTTFAPTTAASDDLKPYTFYTDVTTMNPSTGTYVVANVLVTLCKYRTSGDISRVVLMITPN